MSNNKQSSIEWYAEQFAEHIEENYGIKITSLTLLNKAKAMHKEEHENTWIDSRIEDKGDDHIGRQKSFNDYYNETFNNDGKK